MADPIIAYAKLPGHRWWKRCIGNDLQQLQTFVRGGIETCTLLPGLVVICNRDALLRDDFPENCTVLGVTFHGPILLVGAEEDEFVSVSDDDIRERLPDAWLEISGGG